MYVHIKVVGYKILELHLLVEVESILLRGLLLHATCGSEYMYIHT